MNIKIKSMYICVKDMRRAVRFYAQFLEQLITQKDSVLSVFDIGARAVENDLGSLLLDLRFRWSIPKEEKDGLLCDIGSPMLCPLRCCYDHVW